MVATRFSVGGMSLQPGVSGNMADSLPYAPQGQAPEPPAAGGSTATATGATMPHVTLIGFLGLLAAIWLGQRINAHLRENTIIVNVMNFLIIGLSASAAILSAKVIFNRFPVPNLTEAINAV